MYSVSFRLMINSFSAMTTEYSIPVTPKEKIIVSLKIKMSAVHTFNFEIGTSCMYPESGTINKYNELQINPGKGPMSSLYESNKRVTPVMDWYTISMYRGRWP